MKLITYYIIYYINIKVNVIFKKSFQYLKPFPLLINNNSCGKILTVTLIIILAVAFPISKYSNIQISEYSDILIKFFPSQDESKSQDESIYYIYYLFYQQEIFDVFILNY